MSEIIGMIKFTAITLLFAAGLVLTVHSIVTFGSTPPTWHCIEGGEDVGFARLCEVSDCNVLFIGDDVLMECGR